MATSKTDPMQKLKDQLAHQKELVRDLKASVRELKQQLKDQKVSLKSGWQTEIEAQTEKALSVGYELGYLEAVALQRDTMDRLQADMDALYASSRVEAAVDFSGLNDVLDAAVGASQSVPMPAPVVDAEEEQPVAQAEEPAKPESVTVEESFSIESIVRDIVTHGDTVLEANAEAETAEPVLELALEDA